MTDENGSIAVKAAQRDESALRSLAAFIFFPQDYGLGRSPAAGYHGFARDQAIFAKVRSLSWQIQIDSMSPPMNEDLKEMVNRVLPQALAI